MSVARQFRSVPNTPHRSRWVQILAFVTATMLLASACSASVNSITAAQQANTGNGQSANGATSDGQSANGATSDGQSANGATSSGVTFARGEAVLPRDLCPGDGQLLANVLHLDDLATAGLPVSADAYANRSDQDRGSYDVPSYPIRGQVNCSATLGSNDYFYFELHRDGRGLAANYEVREQHTIAGTNFTIYRPGSNPTVWAEATFPNDYSSVGATSLAMAFQQTGDNQSFSEDDAATALLAVAELVLPLVTYDPPAPIIEEEAAPQGASTPDWWYGCDAGNFVFEGVGPEAVFAALGEPAADSVKLSDNPLGVGLLTDCRASNGDTRVSVLAVPPIGGLIESVDDILRLEGSADERTIAGNRAAVYSDDPTSLFPSGTAHFNIDGFSIIVKAEDRDGRQLTGDQLKQMAATAAEAFLTQL